MGSRIPIFPLHTVLLPTIDLGIHVFEDRYRELVAHALSNGHTFGVVCIKRGREVAGPAEPHAIGTLAEISGYAMLPDGRYLLEVEGTQRFRLHASHDDGPFPTAEVSFISEVIGNFAKARELASEVSRLFTVYRTCLGDADEPVALPADPVNRSYVVASLLRIDLPEKQKLLELSSAEERLRSEKRILHRELTLLDHLQTQR